MSNTESKNSKKALQTMQEEFEDAKDFDIIIPKQDGSDVGFVGLKNA
jgi:hypothetical protein